MMEIEKVKVLNAEIIINGTREKPYYEIKYFDLSDMRYHVGYSSHNLGYVFDWLEECFEVVDWANYEGWIPCGEMLPDEHKRVLVTVDWEEQGFKNRSVYDAVYGSDGLWHGRGYEPLNCKVVAWMPLPEAYYGK